MRTRSSDPALLSCLSVKVIIDRSRALHNYISNNGLCYTKSQMTLNSNRPEKTSTRTTPRCQRTLVQI